MKTCVPITDAYTRTAVAYVRSTTGNDAKHNLRDCTKVDVTVGDSVSPFGTYNSARESTP